MNHDKQSKGGIIEKLFPGNNQICVAFLKGLPVIQLSFFSLFASDNFFMLLVSAKLYVVLSVILFQFVLIRKY